MKKFLFKTAIFLAVIVCAVATGAGCEVYPDRIYFTDLPQYGLDADIVEIEINWDTNDGWADTVTVTDEAQIDEICELLFNSTYKRMKNVDFDMSLHTTLTLKDSYGKTFFMNILTIHYNHGGMGDLYVREIPEVDGVRRDLLREKLKEVYKTLRQSFTLTVVDTENLLAGKLQETYPSGEVIEILTTGIDFDGKYVVAYLDDIYLGYAHELIDGKYGFVIVMRNYDCTLTLSTKA